MEVEVDSGSGSGKKERENVFNLVLNLVFNL